MTFEWSYAGTLGSEEAFQVLIWKEGASEHLGAAQSWGETRQTIDLDYVPQLDDGGAGQYLWSVVVVRRGTDERLSDEAPPRRFTYLGPAGQSTPTPTPTNTGIATKIPLPPTCTPKPPSDTPVPPTDTPEPTPTETPADTPPEVPTIGLP